MYDNVAAAAERESNRLQVGIGNFCCANTIENRLNNSKQ